MKKYIQIGVVLGAFFLLVFLRQAKGNDDQPAVIAPQNSQNPDSSSQGSITPTTNTTQVTQPAATTGQYKDGTFTGQVADAFYGNLQVQAVISGGKITDVVFLQYPNDNPTSRAINQQASVYLKEEALAAQSAQVDIVSGASDSSRAFQESLASALSQAK